MKNWKTTLAGLLAGLPQLVTGIMTGNPVTIATAIATIGIGILAKDHDTKE